jgi:hypothetical protein
MPQTVAEALVGRAEEEDQDAEPDHDQDQGEEEVHAAG